jgi:hypothetical protein
LFGSALRRVGRVRGRLLRQLVRDAGADIVDLLGGQAEDRRHRAFAGRHGRLHELPAGAHGADGVSKAEGPSSDMRGVFAQRVARGVAHGESTRSQLRLEHAVGRDGNRQDRRLGMLGQLELVLGAVEDDLRQRKAERVVGFFEDGARGGRSVIQRAAHADGLRSLAREKKCEDGCCGGSCFHAHPQDCIGSESRVISDK